MIWPRDPSPSSIITDSIDRYRQGVARTRLPAEHANPTTAPEIDRKST
jgi:hypothetical protein